MSVEILHKFPHEREIEPLFQAARLASRSAPASARREPGHRRRQATPRPDRLERALGIDRPAVDAAAVDVDRIEEPPVAGEVLVAEPRHAVDCDAGRRILERQRTVGRDREARDGAVGEVRRKANRSSGVTTAQQISLRPLPTDEVRGTSDPSTIAYDDAAAAPFSARKASVTTSAPPDVNAKPYGVGPCEAIEREAPKVPSAATLYVSIESVPRSVITIIDPSGLNATCAGSASLEASA